MFHCNPRHSTDEISWVSHHTGKHRETSDQSKTIVGRLPLIDHYSNDIDFENCNGLHSLLEFAPRQSDWVLRPTALCLEEKNSNGLFQMYFQSLFIFLFLVACILKY